jgi:hypothetical protein
MLLRQTSVFKGRRENATKLKTPVEESFLKNFKVGVLNLAGFEDLNHKPIWTE